MGFRWFRGIGVVGWWARAFFVFGLDFVNVIDIYYSFAIFTYGGCVLDFFSFDGELSLFRAWMRDCYL